MPGSTARVSAISSTFLQAAALHVPSPFVSYFEPFIAAFAFATLPWSPGVLYGAYSGELDVEQRVGDDVVRDRRRRSGRPTPGGAPPCP